MKILHVCESLCAGVLDSVQSICHATATRQGVDVHICYGLRDETPSNLCELFGPEITLHALPGSREIRPWADLQSLREIRRIAGELQPDVVHLHSSKAGFLGRMALIRRSPPAEVFYTPQGWSFLRTDVGPMSRAVFHLLERLGRTFGGTIVACSEGEAVLTPEPLVGRGGEIITIENAVFGSGSDWQRRPAGMEPGGRVKVGTLGRVAPQKNPDLFLEVIRLLGNDDVDFFWIGGGDVAYEAKLLEAGVTVTGWLPKDEALAQLSRLSIYVQTSSWEGLPIAVLQAQRMGLPAVVTDVVGNRSVVEHGRTGFVACGAGPIAEYLQRLIKDEAMRTNFGENAVKATAYRFSEARFQSEILALYGLTSSN